jgi:putative redox protein
MGAVLTASAELQNDRMMFLGESGGHSVTTDYVPPYGDGQGFMPLQLFLVSLTACLGGTVQFLAKAMKRSVSGMTVSAEGDRRETHPTMFENIRLHVRVKSADITDDDMRVMLKKAEETLCPVAAMIKATVPLKMTFVIERV